MERRPPLERREPAVYCTNSKQNENVCFSSLWNIVFKHRFKIGFRKDFHFFKRDIEWSGFCVTNVTEP